MFCEWLKRTIAKEGDESALDDKYAYSLWSYVRSTTFKMVALDTASRPETPVELNGTMWWC